MRTRGPSGLRPGGAPRRALPAAGALLLAACAGGGLAGGLGGPPAQLAPPRSEGGWVLPAESRPARPVWGLEEGLRVSLWPACEVRGALCVHAPSLGLESAAVLSRLVLETGAGRGRTRSAGEGEGGRGVALRPVVSEKGEERLAAPWRPPRLRPEGAGADARLALRLRTAAPLADGVRPELRVTLRRGRPYAVELAVRAAPGSPSPERVALVVERAAFARLRTLWLAERAASVQALWPELGAAGGAGAAERRFESEALERREGDAWITAVPDALLGVGAGARAEEVPAAWRYGGEPTLQYLRTAARPGVAARAAPARRFPGTAVAIPGGPVLRSFALEAPAGAEGVAFVYGAEPR